MLFKTIFLVLALKSGLLLTAASVQQESNTDSNELVFFLQSPVSFVHLAKVYASDLPSPTSARMTNIMLKPNIHIHSLDYHPRTKMFYFTNPRVGYWTKNAQLYSIPWDPDFVCTEATTSLGDFRSKMRNNSGTKEKSDEDDDDKSDSEEEPDEEVKKLVSEAMLGKPICLIDDKSNNTMIFHKQIADVTKLLHERENWNPRSIAVDYIGDKLYIVDTGDAAVSVYDLNGQNKAIVFQNESVIPLEVALDVNRGLMFILAYNTKLGKTQLYRANMDGSSALLIAEHKEELEDTILRDKLGFALNTMKKRVYFANRGQKMYESVDYDGNGRVKIGEADPPLGITAYNDTVFWSNGGTSLTESFVCVKNNCSIMACTINDTDGRCIDNTTAKFEEGKQIISAFDVKSIVPHPKINSNPCEMNNGGCEHHCLLKPSSVDGDLDSGCICREGYRLTENLKNCTKIKVTDVYDDFYLQSPTNLSSLSNLSSENIYPLPRNLLYRLKYERPDRVFVQTPFIFLEIDNRRMVQETQLSEKDSMTSNESQDFAIAFLGLGHVMAHRCSLASDPTLVWSPDLPLAEVLTYDWIAKNVYYVRLSNSSDELPDLMAFRFELPGRICVDDQKDVSHYRSQHVVSIAKIPEPASMEVHPYKGYIFASLRNGSLIRLNTDGSNKIDFPNVNNSVMLATDLSDDKIYWLDSDDYVNYANLDGSDPKQLFKSPVNVTLNIKIFGDHVFILEKEKSVFSWENDLSKLWRFNKLTGKASGTLAKLNKQSKLYRESLGFKVRAKDARYVDADDNPCAVSNGGCESLCFAVPKEDGAGELRKVCACGSDEELPKDNKNCELLPNYELEESDDE